MKKVEWRDRRTTELFSTKKIFIITISLTKQDIRGVKNIGPECVIIVVTLIISEREEDFLKHK